MALTATEKKLPAPRPNWDYGYLCRRCHAALVGKYVVQINDPADPNDDEALCGPCARWQPIGPAPESHEGKAFISGALLVGLIVVLIKWLS